MANHKGEGIVTPVSLAGPDGRFRSHAQIKCVDCPATWEAQLNGRLAPELISERARRDGWAVDLRSRTRTRCPACEAARVANRAGEKPDKPERPVMPSPVALPTARAAVLGVLSPDQRAAIRDQIDLHFDCEKGMFIGSASDASIAADLDVPRAAVEQIRETGWGPIRITPEMIAHAREIEALRVESTALRGKADQLLEMLSTVSDRIGTLETRLGALVAPAKAT